MKSSTLATALTVPVLLGLTLASRAEAQAAQTQASPKAIAVIHPAKGEAKGWVSFNQTAAGVQVVAEVHGLTPGDHGFHIHEFGDCSAADASSAGGHFNPHQMPHAGPEAGQRHTGDLGNITADAGGHARYERVDSSLSFSGMDSIIGRGVIVHEKADDLKTQPTGDAGARLGCGVIGVAKP
jgi:Cu-Zn family superoxide dismutase